VRFEVIEGLDFAVSGDRTADLSAGNVLGADGHDATPDTAECAY
jgi:hypothetical protein